MFLAAINTKLFWNSLEEKYFVPLRILYPFIKTFFESSFNLFSITTCVVLFKVICLFKFVSLSSKSVFFMKLAISLLLAKFTCTNLAANLSDVNLLNSWVVIYLSWSWSVVFFSISLLFVLQSVFQLNH